MALVSGTVGEMFTIASKEAGKAPRRIIQILTHDGQRLGLEEIADMSPDGYFCAIGQHVSLECRVSEWHGRVQYSYWGADVSAGNARLGKLFGGRPSEGIVDNLPDDFGALPKTSKGNGKADEKTTAKAPF